MSSLRSSPSTAAPAPAPIAARDIGAVKGHGRGDTGVRALGGVTVDLPAGRSTAVMGPSGSGKSTLLHCLAGLDTLTSGTVVVGGLDLGDLPDAALTKVQRERMGSRAVADPARWRGSQQATPPGPTTPSSSPMAASSTACPPPPPSACSSAWRARRLRP